MWSVSSIVGVAVAGGVAMFVTGVVIARGLENRRRKQFPHPQGLITRSLSTYHRPKLSVNEDNYSHVTLPTESLRRSAQLPYAALALGWTEPGPRHSTRVRDLHDESTARNKSKGSVRRPFNGQHLYIPKTRRSKRLKKMSPLDQIQHSPLSAIIESTDSRGCISPVIAELPCEPTRSCIPPDGVNHEENRLSIQWPLPSCKTSTSEPTRTEVTSIAARTSVLVRKTSGLQKTSGEVHSSIVPRSVSMTSTASTTPDDPLPPLPNIETFKHSRVHDLRTRASNASLETVGSSVLGTVMSSPSNAGTELTIPVSDLNGGFSGFDFNLNRKSSTPKLQLPPVKQMIHGLCIGKPSIRSLHPSVDMNASSPEPSRNYSTPRPLPVVDVCEDSLKTIDASAWGDPLPLLINKNRLNKNGTQRHSMYEPSKILEWRAASDSLITDCVFEPSMPLTQCARRPASVATANPLQWDQQVKFATNRHSLTSLDGPKRGHRRQNCVRITNLPSLDLDSKRPKIGGMPQVEEEKSIHYLRTTVPERHPQTATEVMKPELILKGRPSLIDIKASPTQTPSPLRNQPILTFTGRPVGIRSIHAPSSVSSGTPRPDSDVFDSAHVQITRSNQYVNSSPRHWPLSPTPLSTTPPSAQRSDYQPADSPILPSPAFDSSSLYPRKSLVKGPRNPRESTQSFRTNCASPLQHKQGNSFRISKDRDLCAGDIDLRKSVMMLRSMNSEGRLLDHQSNRIYRNVGDTGDEYGSTETIKMLTPPLNNRVTGLRNSRGASSVMGVSPNLDKQVRGSNSLTHGNTSRLNRARTSGTTHMYNGLSLHPAMSGSSSAMSIGAVSIWEDASVRDDSPEPEIPTLRPIQATHPASRKVSSREQHIYQTPPPIIPLEYAQYQHRLQLHPPQRPKTPTKVHVHRVLDTENSNLVQRLERVVSNGQWDGKRHGSGSHSVHSEVCPSEQRSETGLGLRIGDAGLGELGLASRPTLFT